MAKSKKTSGKAEKAGKNDEVLESKSMIPGEGVTPEKASSEPAKKKQEAKQEQESQNEEPTIRILYHGSCPKLSTRGAGKLEYDIGIDDGSDEPCLRISGNESTGAYSTKWVTVKEIRNILDNAPKKTFKAIILKELYMGRSTNNHGYLTAILKAEGVVAVMAGKQTELHQKTWEPLMEKITSLKGKDISLPDHVGMAAKKRAEAKAKRLAEKQAVAKEKKENKEKDALETAQAGNKEEV
ncbi:hypothetical protein [Desulfocicer niacini]